MDETGQDDLRRELESLRREHDALRVQVESAGQRRTSGARAAVVCSAVLAALVAPLALAQNDGVQGRAADTGDTLREGVRNGTASEETEIIGAIDASIGSKGGYVTRQSNTRTGANAGGAAIYGCRAPATSPEQCLRASNLSTGQAFSFATDGPLGGVIEVGDPAGAPFATNATGLVANLNADKVDGLDASQLQGRTGPPGPAGPAGATGSPGPSVAGYAVLRTGSGSTLPSDSSYGSTGTLNTGADNSGPIEVSFPARLIVTGTTELQNSFGSTRGMSCRLVRDPAGARQVISADAPRSVPAFAETTATVTGAVDVAPGTHNVGMECATQPSNPGGVYSDVSLTVVAVGR